MKPPVFGILLGSIISLIWVSPTSFSANEAGIIRFSGETSQGTSFKKKLWSDLAFVLRATGVGWDISVTDGKDADTDFVWVATPPYRFDNPRYLGTGYGHSAKEAIAWTPRAFNFVVNRTDYSIAANAVRKLLWPSGISDAELRTAELNLMRLPKANGLLKIKQAKLSGTNGATATHIESLAFEVEIRQPIDLQARSADSFSQRIPNTKASKNLVPVQMHPLPSARPCTTILTATASTKRRFSAIRASPAPAEPTFTAYSRARFPARRSNLQSTMPDTKKPTSIYAGISTSKSSTEI